MRIASDILRYFHENVGDNIKMILISNFSAYRLFIFMQKIWKL